MERWAVCHSGTEKLEEVAEPSSAQKILSRKLGLLFSSSKSTKSLIQTTCLENSNMEVMQCVESYMSWL